MYDFFGGGDISKFCQETNYGYLVCGVATDTSNHQVMGLLKIDKQGNEIEKITYDLFPNKYYCENGVFNKSDSCIFLIGTITFPNNDIAAHLTKLNQYGDTLWTKLIYDTAYNSQGNAIFLRPNGELMIVGASDKIDVVVNILVLKTDSLGNLIWERDFGSFSTYDTGWSIDSTLDGGYVIGCGKYNFGNQVLKSYVLKIDSFGNYEWGYEYGNINYSNSVSRVSETQNGKIISAGARGFYKNINNDVYYKPNITWIDSMGTLLNSKNYSVDSAGFIGFSDIVEIANDEYLITGTFEEVQFCKIGLFKTNSNGDSVFARTYQVFDNYEFAEDVNSTSDGGFIICGYNYPLNLSQNFRVIKVDSLGCDTLGCQSVGISENENLWNENNSFLVFPNPNDGKFFVQVKNIPASAFFETRIEVLDLTGKLIFQTRENSFRNISEVDISTQPAGIYFVRAFFDNAPVGSISIVKQ